MSKKKLVGPHVQSITKGTKRWSERYHGHISLNKLRSIHSQFLNGLGRGILAWLFQSTGSNKNPNYLVSILEMNKFFYCISDSHRQSHQKKVKEYSEEKTKQSSWFLWH